MRTKRVTDQLERNEKDVVDNKGPFASVAIGRNAEEDGADGAEHEHQGDAPGDVRVGFAKRLCEVRDGERDSKEVEGVPGLDGVS